MKMQKHCNTCSWVLLATALSFIICEANANGTVSANISVDGSRKKESNSVKKALPLNVDLTDSPLPAQVQQSPVSAIIVKEQTQTQTQQKQPSPVVVISERPAPLLTNSETQNSQVHITIAQTDATVTSSNDDDVQIVKTRLREPFLTNDLDMPDAYRASFYFFFGISSAALLFIVVRVYRLRLSRAERKYGVQGDRANQELTPLPMAIEDINSDEDDHTLFEINRHNIRIL